MTPPPIPDYTFRSLIGEGSTGRVYSAEYRGQSSMAVKAFDSDSINRQLVSDALVKIFNGDEHPGIVAVHDFDLASTQAYMATSLHGEPYQTDDGQEAVRPRTIEGLLGHLIADDAWQYSQQIAEALAFLHRQRVVHCNLQPSNVLLDGSTPPHIKLTDFSQGLVGNVAKLVPGDSVFYAPPEQIRQPQHYFGGRAERWDVYAFGTLTFQLITGDFPRLSAAISEIKKRKSAALDVHFSYDYTALAAMIEREAEVEWPSPATDDDESARRAIIDRCLQVKPEDRYSDMREVVLAFKSLDDELDRRDEHRKFAAEQLRSDKKASGMKKIAALLGALALGGLCSAAYFGQKWNSARNAVPTPPPKHADPVIPTPPEVAVTPTEFEALQGLLSGALQNLRESQAALDEILALVVARDADGTPLYELPESTAGQLLNHYEEFAQQHKANPALALEVARAENNAGEIHLTVMRDADEARGHLKAAVEKVGSLLAQEPDESPRIGSLIFAAATFTQNLSEAEALAGWKQKSSDTALDAQRLWERLHKRNPTSPQATRSLAGSLINVGEHMLAIERPDEASPHLQRAKSILKALESDNELGEDDIVALARCDHLLGKAARAQDKLSDAIDLQIEAIDRLLNLKVASVETPSSQVHSLAIYYGELADTVADDGRREEAEIANAEAIKLLVELGDAAVSNTEYHFHLAQRLSTKAALLRDAGKRTDARTSLEEAISIHKDLLKVHPERHDISYELALDLGDLMDIFAQAAEAAATKERGGLRQKSVDFGDEAVRTMHSLLINHLDPERDDAKRAKYRIGEADLQIRFAGHLEKYGEKRHALKYFEKAVHQLQTIVDGGSATEEVANELKNAQARVKALGG